MIRDRFSMFAAKTYGARASVPNPKFAFTCSAFGGELRIPRDTDHSIVMVWLWFRGFLTDSPRPVRKRLNRHTILFALILVCADVMPALAQFGTIFGDPPPRPPANVPSRPPSDVPYPQQYPQYPPEQRRAPPPPPLSRGIQQQPLPPPPGVTQQPVETRRPPQQEPAPPPQQSILPGLPPGTRQPRGTPQPANTAPQPGDEVIAEPPSQRIPNATAVFSGLDKITGRIISFDVAINETVQFGALQVVPRVCNTRPPTETANTNAFIEVSEVTLQGEVRRIFTGWMYASSPGLHAVEHPIYDIWITDCKAPLTKVAEEPAPAPPPPPQTRQRQQRSQQQRPPQPQRAPPPPGTFSR